jgi:hypothetical protein
LNNNIAKKSQRSRDDRQKSNESSNNHEIGSQAESQSTSITFESCDEFVYSDNNQNVYTEKNMPSSLISLDISQPSSQNEINAQNRIFIKVFKMF